MNPLAIRGLVLIATFAAGAAVNGWRLGEQIAQTERNRIAAVAAENETHRLKERAMSKQVEVARDEAVKREAALRRAAAGSRNAADSLQSDLADLRRSLPELAAEACRERADTLADVFGQCTRRYERVAEKADRHASDVQTLMDGWPE